MREALADRSGLAEVRRRLEDTFTRRAGVLQTLDAVTRMNQLSYRGTPADAGPLARLRVRIEELTDDEDMHEVAELRALATALTGSIELPDDLALDVSRLSSTSAPAPRCGLLHDATDEQVMAAARRPRRRVAAIRLPTAPAPPPRRSPECWCGPTR